MMTPRPEPYFFHAASLASGAVSILGPNGDDDPARALEDIVVSNTGATALRVAYDLTGTQGARYLVVPAGTMLPLGGPLNSLVFKTHTAAASTFSVAGQRFFGNAAVQGGVKPSLDAGRNRTWPGRLNFAAGTTTVTTVKLRSRFALGALKLYAGTAPLGAAITVAVADSRGRNLLAGATFDLETLVAGTLTTLTLAASTDLLTLGPEDLVFTLVSTGGSDACAVAFELTLTEA